MSEYDLAIIGGGPGGYVAAIRASQLGKKTILIEKESLGGVCLNVGCIPTKALLKSASVYNLLKNSKEYGINAENISFDFEQVFDRSRKVASKLSSGIEYLMAKNNIKVLKGVAKLQNSNQILVESNINEKSSLIKAKKIIVATGARPKEIKGFEADNKLIWNYKNAILSNSLPKSVIIIGAGAIGVEFACIYNSFGCNVVLLEARNRILPLEDLEVSKYAAKSFSSSGIRIITDIKLVGVKKNHESLDLLIKDADGKEIHLNSEKLLISVGIVPNVEDLGIENTKISLENGFIKTDQKMKTEDDSIYAIGDVTEGPWLAHKASHEGVVAVENIFGINSHKIKKENIPACVYSFPQIASIGYTEEKAIELGYKIRIGKFPFSANGKSIANGAAEGFVKTIFDSETGELLGAHIIGDDASELIHSYVIAKNLESTEHEIINSIFAHPTSSEALHESVLAAFDIPIHVKL